ncbi:glycerol-3-phosphate dehydrogenase, NAD-dependent [Bifidobacterium actinocoloniiforme DSM 22766]|uniref:Glycerol-3-phosphate dehydrogenase [NAD(P)+] n=1 Tax=Bifidobacterium actinocoloniiforme DSM 22766 TaxID=1437605 RepID=A0A086YYU3_9BIFI|nr:NAD(P)H-dependent glycerol-3-phosphate dehydrogenase [Bifidobacterium actinocoloniiforme]AKV55959.1 glycerol-3-phosphate acyltransferase [Bifidobacterium actinocoloniiforme DSM 22766]KFI39443.1 glycerol-3-phosphate dehydrogenase, NAD-dependent [Bifidobacterium actinocoloniiforme DSM 22766]
MTKIAVLGAGAWGTTFGQVLADAGNQVVMWGIEPAVVDAINHDHRNPVRTPTIERLPDAMTASLDREEAVDGAGIVVVAIAAQHAREALEPFRPLIGADAVVVSLMKGIERTTDKRMDQVVTEALGLPEERFAAVSGPNLSREVAVRQPSAAVVASVSPETAQRVAQACEAPYFKPFVSTDVIGLELCGALKNVTALAVGMSRGAGYGENTAAMIQARGLAELTALGEAAGADAKTFAGLAGVGDLIATCASSLSRNYTFGFNLGRGMSIEEATEASQGVAEGVPATNAVVGMGRSLGEPTPLAQAMSHVLDQGLDCAGMIEELFGGPISAE